MSIYDNRNKTLQDGNGTQTAFEFNFKIFKDIDLKVYKINKETREMGEPLLLFNDYTVAINKVGEGGTVIFTIAPTENEQVGIYRELEIIQPADIPVDTEYVEKTIENALDRSCIIDQQLQEQLNRCITLPVFNISETGDRGAIKSLPYPKAGKALKWNDEETGLVNSDVSIDDLSNSIDVVKGYAQDVTQQAKKVEDLSKEILKRPALVPDNITILEDEDSHIISAVQELPLFTSKYFDFPPNIPGWVKAGGHKSGNIYKDAYTTLKNILDKTNTKYGDNFKIISKNDFDERPIVSIKSKAPYAEVIAGTAASKIETLTIDSEKAITKSDEIFESFAGNWKKVGTQTITAKYSIRTHQFYFSVENQDTDQEKYPVSDWGIEAIVKSDSEFSEGETITMKLYRDNIEEWSVSKNDFNEKFKKDGTYRFTYSGNNWHLMGTENDAGGMPNINLADYGITSVGGTPQNNLSEIEVTLKTNSIYNDYWIIDEENKEFRTPLYNHDRVLIAKEEPSNGNRNWFRLYSDGYCEQGGNNAPIIAGYFTVKLPIPYRDTEYTILHDEGYLDVDSLYYRAFCNKTESGFKIYRDYVVDNNWKTSGYVSLKIVEEYAKKNNIGLYYLLGDGVVNKNLIDVGVLLEEFNKAVEKLYSEVHVIDTYVNGTSGYRVWSDGYCEQWGRLTMSADSIYTINLLKEMKDTNYICLNSRGVDGYYSSGNYGRHDDEPFNFTTTSFDVYGHSAVGLNVVQWKVTGYLKEGEY